MAGEAKPFPFPFPLSFLFLAWLSCSELRSGSSRWLWRREDARSLRVWFSKSWIRRLVGVAGAGLGDGTPCEEAVLSRRKFLGERLSLIEGMVRSDDREEREW